MRQFVSFFENYRPPPLPNAQERHAERTYPYELPKLQKGDGEKTAKADTFRVPVFRCEMVVVQTETFDLSPSLEEIEAELLLCIDKIAETSQGYPACKS